MDSVVQVSPRLGSVYLLKLLVKSVGCMFSTAYGLFQAVRLKLCFIYFVYCLTLQMDLGGAGESAPRRCDETSSAGWATGILFPLRRCWH